VRPNTLDTAGMADDPLLRPPHFDLWVCRGRMCTANGSNGLAAAFDAAVVDEPCVTVLRGGCYGLCDLGPNVVVRRHVADAAVDRSVVEHSAADRLTLTGADNESVYCGVDVADVVDVVHAHVVDDSPLVRLERAVREQELAPTTEIERRMRALRAMRDKREDKR